MDCVYIFEGGIEKMYLKHKLLKMSQPFVHWLSLLLYFSRSPKVQFQCT